MCLPKPLFLAAVLAVALGTVGSAPGQTSDQDRLVADFRRAEQAREAGRHDEAARLYKGAVEVAGRLFGADHPDTIDLVNKHGLALAALGRHAEARDAFARCVRAAEAGFPDGPRLPRFQTNLGSACRLTGELARAEPLLRSALRRREKLGAGHEADVAETLHGLAVLLQEKGDLPAAEPLFERCLKLREEKLGRSDPAVADTLAQMGALYGRLGQDAKAEKHYRRGLAVCKERLGDGHLQTAAVAHDLAVFHLNREKYAKAEPLLRPAMATFERRLGAGHADTAKAYHSLAWVCFHLGKADEAGRLQGRAVKVWREAGSPLLSFGLVNQGVMALAGNRPAAAEAAQREALQIRERTLPAGHPNIADSRAKLAIAQAAKSRWPEAAATLDQARRSVRGYATAVLPSLSEPEQLAFLARQHAPDLHAALTLGYLGRGEAALDRASAGWVRNGKGVAQEVVAAQVLQGRDSASPALAGLTAKLLATRQQLARLTLSQPPEGREKEHLRQAEELAGREQELAGRLRRLGAGVSPPWVGLEAVRQALPKGGVLIDVARFKSHRFLATSGESRWGPARYAAWLTPKEGDVRVIDLGPAEAIDQAVAAARRAIDGIVEQIREGEAHAEKEVRGPLARLSRLVLHPLLKAAGGATAWRVSPDGNLWLAPWEAMLLPDGRYAVERLDISYLTTGRDLAAAAAPSKAGRSVILANPDYDVAPDAPAAKGARPAAPRADWLEGHFAALRHSAEEARAAAPALRAYAGQEPLRLEGRRARKAALVAAKHPAVLMLSTHGYFRPGGRNPLLRCGLALAGANKTGDGLLTGLEVGSLELRGCELVVLSACETGLGEVRDGEGVAGLRQAFQLAGARSVVSTLWEVDDAASTRLMSLFFDRLSAGAGKAEALRDAKLRMIAERRKKSRAAHPYFWSAFTLTGDPGGARRVP